MPVNAFSGSGTTELIVTIARELVEAVRLNVEINWTVQPRSQWLRSITRRQGRDHLLGRFEDFPGVPVVGLLQDRDDLAEGDPRQPRRL